MNTSARGFMVSILIVEDEHDIREVLTEILEDEGYTVDSVQNGLEALAFLRKHHPQLILLDLGMPVMTGWEFRDQQQRDPALADIPVIVMSATPHLSQTAAALQAADCLDKPIELNALLEMVEHHYSPSKP
jgi:CheY-like chemotaxis protein